MQIVDAIRNAFPPVVAVAGITKSWTCTRCGVFAGRQVRPAFLNAPTSSFFLVSTEIVGCCCRCARRTRRAMYRNCASRSTCWRPSRVLALPWTAGCSPVRARTRAYHRVADAVAQTRRAPPFNVRALGTSTAKRPSRASRRGRSARRRIHELLRPEIDRAPAAAARGPSRPAARAALSKPAVNSRMDGRAIRGLGRPARVPANRSSANGPHAGAFRSGTGASAACFARSQLHAQRTGPVQELSLSGERDVGAAAGFLALGDRDGSWRKSSTTQRPRLFPRVTDCSS